MKGVIKRDCGQSSVLANCHLRLQQGLAVGRCVAAYCPLALGRRAGEG